MTVSKLSLVDLLDRATINGPQAGVAVRDISLGRDGRIGLFQHPDSEVIFPAHEILAPARLRFAIGMLASVWDRMQSAVEFSIALRDSAGAETPVFARSINPRHQRDERCWLDHEIELPAIAGPVQIVLRTRVARRKGTAWCWATWGDPVLIETATPSIPTAEVRSQPVVVLVTSDALRMDHVGCYGGVVATPHLDRLAAEGARFPHARTQSSVSLGAYASLLTSRNPLVHRITGEFGTLPERLLSLPAQFAAWGYHTILAASEAELDDPEAGFSRLFAERIPTVGHPAQAGEITVRRLLERMQGMADRPTFLWLQFFDTHPPLLARGEYSRRYYAGDPSDPQNRHMPEMVGEIRGVESLADLLASIERMRVGEPQASITIRLRGTADALLGRTRSGPDLAEHLRSAPRELTRKLELPAFAHWLDSEVRALEAGQPASRTLMDWLDRLLPFLRSIEAEIVAWLDGVEDYKYALAQYQAAATYMDTQIGQLRQGMEAMGFDDNVTWIFTSPHGEALGESNVAFHHHLLHESCLRVPLIIRPAPLLTSGTPWTPGRTVGGIVDLVDIYPTLLDAYGLPTPTTLEGHSRWTELLEGKEIEPHPSFSVDRNGVAVSVADATHKHWLSLAPHSITARVGYQAGERRWLAIDGVDEQVVAAPADRELLENALARWLDSCR